MKKHLLLFAIIGLLLSSCNNKSTDSSNSVTNSSTINNEVLKVKLGDTREQVIEKLNQQSYNWKETVDAISFISIKDKVQFSGFTYNQIDYTIMNSKVLSIQLRKEFETEESARKGFEDMDNKLSEKYSQFKTDNTNELTILYSEYKDEKTSLTLMLYYHPKEDVPSFASGDAELLKMSREYWEIAVLYMSNDASLNSISNDF